MAVKKLSLVKYAGTFWVTLADYSATRDTTGYSGEASVKAAIRTFVVKTNPDKYIAFRGELQLKNIIAENKNNPLFQEEDFQGTRTALIHFSMVDTLSERFKVSEEYKDVFTKWLKDAKDYINTTKEAVAATPEATDEMSARSIMLRQMRQELSRIDKQLEVLTHNKEKLLRAINAIESLEIEESTTQ